MFKRFRAQIEFSLDTLEQIERNVVVSAPDGQQGSIVERETQEILLSFDCQIFEHTFRREVEAGDYWLDISARVVVTGSQQVPQVADADVESFLRLRGQQIVANCARHVVFRIARLGQVKAIALESNAKLFGPYNKGLTKVSGFTSSRNTHLVPHVFSQPLVHVFSQTAAFEHAKLLEFGRFYLSNHIEGCVSTGKASV